MWVFLSDAMLSIVQDRQNTERLLVRARFEGDLERAFPGVPVEETPAADYRYRIFQTRGQVARRLAEAVLEISYPNFKGSVPLGDLRRHAAYTAVWGCMASAQARAHDPVGQPALPWDDDDRVLADAEDPETPCFECGDALGRHDARGCTVPGCVCDLSFGFDEEEG